MEHGSSGNRMISIRTATAADSGLYGEEHVCNTVPRAINLRTCPVCLLLLLV